MRWPWSERRTKSCACLVRLESGGSFAFDGKVTWKVNSKDKTLVVTKDGKVALEAPLYNVSVVTGPITLFEGTWWK